VKKIYETLFGVLGAKVASEKIIFPSGVPPVTLPKISPATKVKGAQ
jgi:penicillin-binding protein 2